MIKYQKCLALNQIHKFRYFPYFHHFNNTILWFVGGKFPAAVRKVFAMEIAYTVYCINMSSTHFRVQYWIGNETTIKEFRWRFNKTQECFIRVHSSKFGYGWRVNSIWNFAELDFFYSFNCANLYLILLVFSIHFQFYLLIIVFIVFT